MSEKRRDNRNRILRSGESQRKDGIDTIGKKMTVCELYAKQNRHRGNIRHNTTKGRERLMKLLEADKLGSFPIDNINR